MALCTLLYLIVLTSSIIIVATRVLEKPDSGRLHFEALQHIKEKEKPKNERTPSAQAFNSFIGIFLKLEKCANQRISDASKKKLVRINNWCFHGVKKLGDKKNLRPQSRLDAFMCLSMCNLEEIGLLDKSYKPQTTHYQLEQTLSSLLPGKVVITKLADNFFKCTTKHHITESKCATGLPLQLCVINALQMACNSTLKFYDGL